MKASALHIFGAARGRKSLRVTTLFLVLGLLTACKTSDDATRAANQLTSVSQQLSAYYTGLSTQTQDSITLIQIQETVMELPPSPAAKTALDTTRVELDKRVALAKAVANVATAYSALAGSKSAGDIATAASGLAEQCSSIKPLPGGPAIPDTVGQAGQMLVDAVRERKLRQSSQGVSKAVAAVATMFRGEIGIYESINSDRLMVAAQVAEHLVTRENFVDTGVLLSPALKPFDLSASIPANQAPAKYRALAKSMINTRRDQQISDFATTTQNLAGDLDAVSKQIASVSGKHLATK